MISKMIQRGYVTTNLKNDQCQWPMSRWWFYLKKKKKNSQKMPLLTQWTSRRMKQVPRRVYSFPRRFCSIFFLSHKAFKFLPLQLQWKEVSKIWNADLTVKRVKFSRFLRPSRNRTQSGCSQEAITARDSAIWKVLHAHFTERKKTKISPKKRKSVPQNDI